MPSATELTGAWIGEDGGAYYIQGLDDGTVAWAGLYDHGFHKGVAFTNVFLGRLSQDGKTIDGSWADVPRGGTLNSGTLSLAVEHTYIPPTFQPAIQLRASGGFAAGTLRPSPPFGGQIQLAPQDIEALESRVQRVDNLLAENNPPCRDFSVMWGTIEHVNTPPWPNDPNINPYDYETFLGGGFGDSGWDGDLDFDLRPDFSRQEPDFWTNGWVEGSLPGGGLPPNEFILHLFDVIDPQDQRFHCEIMMYAREAAFPLQPPPSPPVELMPAWLSPGGNSVLVNGWPINGNVAAGEGLTFSDVGPGGKQTITLAEGTYARVTGVVADDAGHDDVTPEIHPVYAVDVVQNFTHRPPLANINLTGAWAADDMGTYYMRQIGNALWWLGMSRDQGRTFAHVFHGTVAGQVIRGEWIDVPMGENAILGNGNLTLSGGSLSTSLVKTS